MNIGYIGLGKMGSNMVRRLVGKGHHVCVFDVNEDLIRAVAEKGAYPTYSPEELVESLETLPRVIWTMVPHQAVDALLERLIPILSRGDIVIDGGNSFYKDSIRRAGELAKHEIEFFDVGVSGGPAGALAGACVMVGGKKELFQKFESLFIDISTDGGYAYVGASGAGHFVKMIHNGIEYGIMQSIADGFAILKAAPFGYDLMAIADLYNHQSVIESRLMGWLKDAYDEFGADLKLVDSVVAHTGEGEWTVATAKELGVPVPAIQTAVDFRMQSIGHPSYSGKILTALRNMFGGHAIR